MWRAANLVSVYHELCNDNDAPMAAHANDQLPDGAITDKPANTLDEAFGNRRLKPLLREVKQ